MTIRCSTRIPTHDIDTREGLEHCMLIDPSSALLKVWHAEAQMDMGQISSKELTIIERLAGTVAGRARTIFNPYSGEIRKQFLPDWIGRHKPEDPPQVGWRK